MGWPRGKPSRFQNLSCPPLIDAMKSLLGEKAICPKGDPFRIGEPRREPSTDQRLSDPLFESSTAVARSFPSEEIAMLRTNDLSNGPSPSKVFCRSSLRLQ